MKLSFCLLALALPFLSAANTGKPTYRYTVDIENISGDQVHIELATPEIKKNVIRFYLPKVVPGTYEISDFGRFVQDFQALDKDGNVLHVERDDINTFVIRDAKKLASIRYKVNDSFDDAGPKIYGMSGTNIEEGRGVVFNPHGFVGYFEDMKEIPFEMKVKKAEGYYGASALPATYPDAKTEIFHAHSYNYLVDMPILFAKPDTTTVRVGNTDVLIAVSSPSGRATSEYMAKHFADVLEAERAYMGGSLPVNKYAFLMHFLSPGVQVGTGALEHNYSSLYVLPDFPQEQFIQPLKDIAAHEFFHIISPLNVHSEEIRYFDFNDPEMSRHLWMYEGVTEYFSHHAQLVHGITDMDYFLNQMQNKVNDALSNYNDNLSFTKMSRNCLTTHHAQYGNVYQKGALIGLCLDVILRKESKGEMGLMDLMLKLMDKYGKEQPFKDKQLFREIGKLSYPEAQKFLKTYVAGKKPLPLQEVFGTIGVEYTPPGTKQEFTYGNVSWGFNQETKRIMVVSTDDLNDFGKKMGYMVGDELVSINGTKIDPANPVAAFNTEKEKFEIGKTLTIEVVRKERDGSEKTVTLSAPMQKVEMASEPSLKKAENLTEEQKVIWGQWKQGAGKELGRS